MVSREFLIPGIIPYFSARHLALFTHSFLVIYFCQRWGSKRRAGGGGQRVIKMANIY